MEGKPFYTNNDISIAPLVMLHFNPPCTTNDHEPLINKFTYFKTEFDMYEGLAAKPHKLRAILLQPEAYQNRLKTMKMVDELGELFPVHLPLLEDMFSYSQGFKMFIKNEIEGLDNKGSCELIPDYLANLIDPKPILDLTAPLYALGNLPIRVLFGSYTDSFQACQVLSNNQVLTVKVMHNRLEGCTQNGVEIRSSRRFHDVLINPTDANDFAIRPKPLKMGSVIICWNGRGMARESFSDNFEALLLKYRASIFVITESRISKSNLLWIMGKLGERWGHSMTSEFSAKGGVVIIYDRVKTKLHDFLYEDEPLEASVMIQV